MLLDYAYLGIMLASAFFGYTSGFLKSLSSCAIWFGSGYCTQYLIPYTADICRSNFQGVMLITLMTYITAFGICFSIGVMITTIICENVEKPILGEFDRLGGLFMGAIRGLIPPLLLVILFIILDIPITKYKFTSVSKITKYTYSSLKENLSDFNSNNVNMIEDFKNDYKYQKLRENFENDFTGENESERNSSRKKEKVDLSVFLKR